MARKTEEMPKGKSPILYGPKCRFCEAPLQHIFADLGMSPLCESFLAADQLNQMEPFYPLLVYVCGSCLLVQVQEYVSPEEIFNEYAYYSSYFDSWVQHAKSYAHMVIDRFALGVQSQVIEVASNDGYLLQHFVESKIPVLGIEPAGNVAQVAVKKGIPTKVTFFGQDTAGDLVREGKQADLVIGNNVLAQVPNINDFVAGIKTVLKADGVVTLEFPHLMRLMEENQFDTIYHEHFSYFSFFIVEAILAAQGLTIFDVEELPTHGGSIRIFARHTEYAELPVTDRVTEPRTREEDAGFAQIEHYTAFAAKVKKTKNNLLEFLIHAKQEGKSVAGYGAPGKGNTLLNYCGVRTDYLDYTVDRNPHKHGKFLPGTHIPIFPPEKINETKPDYVLILPWNLKTEVMAQMSGIREWNGRFVVPIPEVVVYP